MAVASPHGPADDHVAHLWSTDARPHLSGTDRCAINSSEQPAVGKPDNVGPEHRGTNTGPHHAGVVVTDAAAVGRPDPTGSNFSPEHGPHPLAVGRAVHA